MKQLTKTRSMLHYARALLRTLYALRPGRHTLEHFITSFLLCGISFGYGPVPFAICLLTVCERKYISAVTLGMLAGYGLFWGLADSFAPYSVTAIVLCGKMLFAKSAQNQTLQFICIGATAVVGLLFLIGDRLFVPAMIRWTINLVSACTGVFLFQKAVTDKHFGAKLLICCGLLLGLTAIHLPAGFSLAILALSWAAGGSQGLCYTAAGCGALAAVLPHTAPYGAVFCPTALIHRFFPRKHKVFACIVSCCIYTLAGIHLHSYSFSVCGALGSILGLFVRPEEFLPAPSEAKLPEHPAQRELHNASEALLQASQMLSLPSSAQKWEIADIFDSAAAQVCQNCSKYNTCWQVRAQELYEDLTACADSFFSKGYADASDFPQRFLSQCIHPEAFVTATNDALDHARAHQRFRSRLKETREAAKNQYEAMGIFLQRLSNRLYAPSSAINYSPEIAVQASGRGGSTISGDRGAAFTGPDGTYFVLLCDGMGTGSAAAQESTQAIRMLRQLLVSGLDALSALNALNGVYILRDNGCFSTVDLLQINLTSGDAILYKWGAAPSYLKRQRGLRFLGGATLPPGLSQNGGVEQIRFSLENGSVLILLSDGLGGKESQRRLESCESLYPKDVAGSLFVGRENPDDDCTAVAIRLRPAPV